MPGNLFGLITTTASAQYTPYALESLLSTTPIENHDSIILIDNDGTYSLPESCAGKVEVIRNDSPKGFAENGNRLITLALERSSDFYFLNNDIILTPGWYEPLFQDKDSILSPLSNREYQYTLGELRTQVAMELEDYLPHAHLLPQILECHRQRSQGFMRVLIVPFFCVKLPLYAMKSVGSFDESFGKGGAEDYDYCLRAVLKEIPIRYALSSYIIHFGGKSSWSGAETPEQQRAREEKFHSVFKQKWGQTLWGLTLDDSYTGTHDLSSYPEIKEGRYKDLVVRLSES